MAKSRLSSQLSDKSCTHFKKLHGVMACALSRSYCACICNKKNNIIILKAAALIIFLIKFLRHSPAKLHSGSSELRLLKSRR